ncbi:XRCC4-like factor-domain-containing protein [Aspergillus varians]
MPEKWQRLHLANDGGIPPLLFKYSPTAGGYELYMTDLNYMWSEQLDRNAILKRADKDDATIDPSEDPEQFQVLLQKIGDGLQNESGSRASLIPETQGRAHALQLTVASRLPAPLKPLKWKFHLSKEPQSSMTSHLLLPFINAEADREVCQQSLIEDLNKKDWVLGKLFDKIEAMGIDLSTIFPGISGLRSRKGPTLAQAAKYIKGLAPFNEQTWREEFSKSSPNAGLSANIVTEMSVISRVSGQPSSLKPPPDEWWANITRSDDTIAPPTLQDDNRENHKAKLSTDAMDTDTDAGSETGDDDEFERQETPPRFKKPSSIPQKSPPARKDEDDVTQSEDEEATFPKRKRENEKTRVEDQPPPAMRPKVPLAEKSKGLGTIGGKKQIKPKSPSPTPTPSPSAPLPATKSPFQLPPRKQQPQQQPANDDETTDADTDEEPPKSQPKAKTKDSTNPAPKPSRGLGVIGGKKKKQPSPVPEPEPSRPQTQPQSESESLEPQPPQQPPPPKKKKPQGKLGVIGGQKKEKAKHSSSTGTPTPSQTESLSPPASKAKQKQGQDQDDKDVKEEEETRTRFLLLPSSAAKEGKVVKREKTTEPERGETEEKKADRKREELKRQLEAKSKVPAKKKRRF